MKVLVTGGGGFLGSAIVRLLLEDNHDVSILARNRYSHLEAVGAKSIQADISKPKEVSKAMTDIEVVIHTAAKAGVWGSKESYWTVNVDGTQNLLDAAQESGVLAFIHTSSPSAVWSGGDEENLRESDCPYPTTYDAHYPMTKAEAERRVLSRNSSSFKTTALRPHLIWGVGDPHLVPRLLDRHKRLRIIGNGRNKVGLTHVQNAAFAHILAMKEILEDAKNAGKAYFITDLKPVVLWDWINSLFTHLNMKPIDRTIDLKWACRIGRVLEILWTVLPLAGEPPMTRMVAKQMAAHHFYNLEAAQLDFGYHEHESALNGWEEMIQSLKGNKKE